MPHIPQTVNFAYLELFLEKSISMYSHIFVLVFVIGTCVGEIPWFSGRGLCDIDRV